LLKGLTWPQWIVGARGLIRAGYDSRRNTGHIAALVALTLMSERHSRANNKDNRSIGIDQFDECAESLFKDEFDPAEVDMI